ncbi:hypothetical protein AD931_03035 [Gluconobacter oxydans]|uniref:Uncharacterized protein n=1 Tax=Gluconobacter oxydans TaxID=442 RepID=A0AB34XKB0_GLUOY|nr:hypothetical protein AD931_03035 [Gluconobacter oxydans]
MGFINDYYMSEKIFMSNEGKLYSLLCHHVDGIFWEWGLVINGDCYNFRLLFLKISELFNKVFRYLCN